MNESLCVDRYDKGPNSKQSWKLFGRDYISVTKILKDKGAARPNFITH